MNLTALTALVRKDLKLFLGDRRALILSLAAPIAIGAFFGFLFSGDGRNDTAKIPVALVDLDGSALSRAVGARLAEDKLLSVRPETEAQARESVRKGKATAAVLLPRGFGDSAANAFFSSLGKPEVTVFYDPSHGMEMGLVRGLLTQAAMEVVSREMFTGDTGRAAVKRSLAGLDTSGVSAADKAPLQDLLRSVDRWNAKQSEAPGNQRSGGLSLPYTLKEEPVTAGRGIAYNGYAHSFGGMGVQFILFMGIDAGVALLVLRRSGTWQRLRAAPLGRQGILLARALSAAILATGIMLVIFAAARLLFGVRIQGSFAGFLGVTVAFALMTATFGLLIAALGRTPEAARGLAIFGTLIMVMLGGAWVPSFVFPAWLQRATLLVPTRWAVDGLDAMTWRGLGFGAAVGPMAVLLGFAALFGLLALWRFPFEEG
ncbi:ABC transporter permease [Geothrix sp. 21YS21S-2]|uniref:ABC transporter permease n=1 Tax=Geothrix sp. 21YS21S-2 TaxID=3068893 RepID=UPI0027B90FEE|nr:ABC transporter permease [Geothrix sp. 21YS21S-2]